MDPGKQDPAASVSQHTYGPVNRDYVCSLFPSLPLYSHAGCPNRLITEGYALPVGGLCVVLFTQYYFRDRAGLLRFPLPHLEL